MNDWAAKMADDYGLFYLMEANNLSEADVIRVLVSKGLLDREGDYDIRTRLYYGDELD